MNNSLRNPGLPITIQTTNPVPLETNSSFQTYKRQGFGGEESVQGLMNCMLAQDLLLPSRNIYFVLSLLFWIDPLLFCILCMFTQFSEENTKDLQTLHAERDDK